MLCYVSYYHPWLSAGLCVLVFCRCSHSPMAALFSLLVDLQRAAFRVRRGHFDDEDDRMSVHSTDAVVDMEEEWPPRDLDAPNWDSSFTVVWGRRRPRRRGILCCLSTILVRCQVRTVAKFLRPCIVRHAVSGSTDRDSEKIKSSGRNTAIIVSSLSGDFFGRFVRVKLCECWPLCSRASSRWNKNTAIGTTT